MQIGSSHNLPIITGYTQQAPARQSHSSQRAIAEVRQEAVTSPQVQLITEHARARPRPQAQPMFDQSLTYRGEQARRTYQNVELGGEIELMNRLDVKV